MRVVKKSKSRHINKRIKKNIPSKTNFYNTRYCAHSHSKTVWWYHFKNVTIIS